MSSLESHAAPAAEVPVRGAQTVAPVQASALQIAAAILGEGGYTPTQQLNGTLSSAARGQEVAPRPAVAPEPVAEPAVVPEPAVVSEPAVGAVRTVGSGRSAAPAPTRGWFGRLLDKLLGRS